MSKLSNYPHTSFLAFSSSFRAVRYRVVYTTVLTYFFLFLSFLLHSTCVSILKLLNLLGANLFLFLLQFRPSFTLLDDPLRHFLDTLAWTSLVLE